MLNVELLESTLEHIENNPQEWHQGAWFYHNGTEKFELIKVEEVNSCNTAFCFAGHAALKAGFFPPPKSNMTPWRIIDADDNYVYVENFARDKLGLTVAQADALFASDNTMEDLHTLVKAIIEDPNIEYQDLYELTERYNSYNACGDDDCEFCS